MIYQTAVSGSLLDAFADEAKHSLPIHAFYDSQDADKAELNLDKANDLAKMEASASATDDRPQKPDHHSNSLAQQMVWLTSVLRTCQCQGQSSP